MDPYRKLIQETEFFPGEFDALVAEFCGRFSVGLAQIPLHKRDRVVAWLSYPTAEREAAFQSVSEWAQKPIAAALDALKNPTKYQAKPAGKPTRMDKTIGTLAAWLDESES